MADRQMTDSPLVAVLAAGLGTRFGGDKLDADCAGKPLGRWVLLLLLAGAGFGAAAVRGAYRRPPDWSAPLLATPAGALPTGAVSSALRGPDLALVVVVPLAVAVVVGAASWGLVVAQAVVAVGAVVVASWVPAPDHG